MRTMTYEGVFSMPKTRKTRNRRAGPGRPSEYGEPLRLLSMNIPQSKFEEFDNMCKRLGVSRPKGFIMLLDHRHEDILKLMAENRQLKDEIRAKDETIHDLEKQIAEKDQLIEKLYAELEKKDRIISRLELKLEACKKKIVARSEPESEVNGLISKLDRIFAKTSELTLAQLLRKLGDNSDYERLKRNAEAFVDKWFKEEGEQLVSPELGLVIKKSSKVGILGWRVRRATSHNSQFQFPGGDSP